MTILSPVSSTFIIIVTCAICCSGCMTPHISHQKTNVDDPSKNAILTMGVTLSGSNIVCAGVQPLWVWRSKSEPTLLSAEWPNIHGCKGVVMPGTDPSTLSEIVYPGNFVWHNFVEADTNGHAYLTWTVPERYISPSNTAFLSFEMLGIKERNRFFIFNEFSYFGIKSDRRPINWWMFSPLTSRFAGIYLRVEKPGVYYLGELKVTERSFASVDIKAGNIIAFRVPHRGIGPFSFSIDSSTDFTQFKKFFDPLDQQSGFVDLSYRCGNWRKEDFVFPEFGKPTFPFYDDN